MIIQVGLCVKCPVKNTHSLGSLFGSLTLAGAPPKTSQIFLGEFYQIRYTNALQWALNVFGVREAPLAITTPIAVKSLNFICVAFLCSYTQELSAIK